MRDVFAKLSTYQILVILVAPSTEATVGNPRIPINRNPPDFDANYCIHVYKVFSSSRGPVPREDNKLLPPDPLAPEGLAVYFTNVCDRSINLFYFVQAVYDFTPTISHPTQSPTLSFYGILEPGERFSAGAVFDFISKRPSLVPPVPHSPRVIDFQVVFCADYAPDKLVAQGVIATSTCKR